jgi:hypothetical protein
MAFHLSVCGEAATSPRFAPFVRALERARHLEAACANLPRAGTQALCHARVLALRGELFRRADAPPPGVEPVPPYDSTTLERVTASLGVDPFRRRGDGPPSARERLVDHLRSPGEGRLPLPLLEALTAACFERSRPLRARNDLRLTLALAPPAERPAWPAYLSDASLACLRERLWRRGVDDSPAWAGTFLARLDEPAEAAAYDPSAALARALFDRGAAWWAAAERVLGALRGVEREEALGARAAALYLSLVSAASAASVSDRGANAALAALRALPAGRARESAALSLARHACDRARPDDACAFATAGATRVAGRIALVVAEAWRRAGDRLEARRWLARVRSPHLAPWVELERTRLDLDAGMSARAAVRLAALPRGLLCPSRATPPWLGTLPTPGQTPAGFAAEGLALRLEIVLRRGRQAPPLALTKIEQRALAANHAGLARLWNRLDSRLQPESAAAAVEHAGPPLRLALIASWVAHSAGAILRELDAALAAPLSGASRPAISPTPSAAFPSSPGRDPAPPDVSSLAGSVTTHPALAFTLGTHGDRGTWQAFRARSAPAGPSDWARSCYDEGVSLSPARDAHREALTRACRAVLREALGPQTRTSAAVVASRLRCLTNLGAERAAASLERVVREAPAGGPHLRAVFLHLLRLAPARAGTLFLERPAIFYDGEVGVFQGSTAGAELARALEAQGVFEPHSAEAWVELAGRVSRHWPNRGATLAWLDAFGPLWLQRFGRAPGVTALRALSGCLLAGPMTPEEALAHLDAQREQLVTQPPGEFFDALTADPLALSTLRSLAPADDGSGGGRWNEARWRSLLDRLRELPVRVDEAPVKRLANELARERREKENAGSTLLRARLKGCERETEGPAIMRALLEGRCPVPDGTWPLGDTGDHLRYLDKRRDVLAFLRLADCVMCCFHSASNAYGDPATSSVGNYRWVLALWSDPLSFCLHLRSRSAEGPPLGFVFGSFALVAGRPALLLNGVYLKRQDEPTRHEVLACVETRLARPLGVAAIAVGNRFGGRGPLPRGYHPVARTTLRLRALQDYDGKPLHAVYDDISSVTNLPFVTASHIHWKDLS